MWSKQCFYALQANYCLPFYPTFPHIIFIAYLGCFDGHLLIIDTLMFYLSKFLFFLVFFTSYMLTNNSLISIKVYAYCNLNPLAFFELFPLLLLIITLLCRTILTCRLHRSAAWKWFPPFHHWSLCLKSMGGLLSSFLLSNNVLTVMACRKIYGAVIVCTEYLSMLLKCLFIAE